MQFFSPLLVFVALFVACLTVDTEIHSLTHFAAASKCGGKEKASTLLDVSKDLINKAKDLYPNCVEDEHNCGQKEKSFAYLDVAMNVISKVKKQYPTCPEPECPEHVDKPVDCSDVLRLSGNNESGVYTIWPRIFANKSLDVYCDMDTQGGGWTVIQRRGKFSTPKDYFYKDWESYKIGFGNLNEEFWIGNDNIFAISNQAFLNKPYKIRFDLTDHRGYSRYAEYTTFWIEDESTNYTLHIEGYNSSSTVGNSLTNRTAAENVHLMMFTTKDRDNDRWSENCAVAMQGAWWYARCGDTNLNGLYQPGIDSSEGITWFTLMNWIGLSAVEIKIRS